MQKKKIPESSSNLLVNCTGITLVYCVIIYYLIFDAEKIKQLFAFLPYIYALPIILLEKYVLKSYVHQIINKTDYIRVATKIYGLIVLLSICALIFWLFPIYHKIEYGVFYGYIKIISIFIIPFLIAYFLYIDIRAEEPYDGYWHIGTLCLGKFNQVSKVIIVSILREWLIKVCFLPFVVIITMTNLTNIVNFDITKSHKFYEIFVFLMSMLLLTDCIPAFFGYSLQLKWLNNQIKSTDCTLFGWFVTLMCYPPFFSEVIYVQYLKIDLEKNWYEIFEGLNWLVYIWAAIIMGLFFIYAVASLCFGLRWSNLTYRGLITSWPYSWTKHPAFVFKNLGWWFSAVPFLCIDGWQEAIRHVIMLLIINIIYYLRAVSEERHLSQYPEYVEYALWINENGKFRFINKYLPFLKYNHKKYEKLNVN